MNFILCDGSWATLPDGAITCTGTLQPLTTDSLLALVQENLIPPGITTEDATELAYSAMGFFAIVFALLALKKALP